MLKKIKKSTTRLFLLTWDKIVVTLLSFIAFVTGCENSIFPAAEYGMPHAHYNINGTVKSKSDQKPVQKIRVLIENENVNTLYQDTFYTDSKGKFAVQYTEFPEEQSWHIRFQDVDGIENGSFSDKDTSIVFKPNELSGGDGDWYEGEATKSFTVFLEKKDND